MENILNDQYLSAIIILVSQLIFIYLRTINVIYTAERKILAAIISGNGVGLSWLVSMAVGGNSMIHGDVIPIIAFLIGGSLGTYFGIKSENRKPKRIDLNNFIIGNNGTKD